MDYRNPIIAIDFDGTCVHHAYPEIGEPLPYAFEVLQRLIKQGDRLILWTCREGKELEDAIEFCKDNGVEFEAYNGNVHDHDYEKSRKPYADLYVDDRVIGGFPGWLVVEDHVRQLRLRINQGIPRVVIGDKVVINTDKAKIEMVEKTYENWAESFKGPTYDISEKFGFKNMEELNSYLLICISNRDWLTKHSIDKLLYDEESIKKYKKNKKEFEEVVRNFQMPDPFFNGGSPRLFIPPGIY